MSINITVHGNTISRHMLGDYERCRREELQRRKLLRLEQVRQQSKDIAAQIRNRVADERKRQIERIDQIKEDEVRAWKMKHLGMKGDELDECLGQVGEAHAAARKENEAEKKRQEQQKQDRQRATKRGREALAKLEEDKRKNAKPAKRRAGATTVKTVASEKSVAESVATQVGDSLSVATKSNNEMLAISFNDVVEERGTQVRTRHISEDSDSLSSSLDTTANILAAAKPYKPREFHRGAPVMESQPTRLNGSAQVEDSHAEQQDVSAPHTERNRHDEQPFTQISEMVNRRRKTNIDIPSTFPRAKSPRQKSPKKPPNRQDAQSPAKSRVQGARTMGSPRRRLNVTPEDEVAFAGPRQREDTEQHPHEEQPFTQISEMVNRRRNTTTGIRSGAPLPATSAPATAPIRTHAPSTSTHAKAQRHTSPKKRPNKQDTTSAANTGKSPTKPTYVPRFTRTPLTQLRVDGKSVPTGPYPVTTTFDHATGQPVAVTRDNRSQRVRVDGHATAQPVTESRDKRPQKVQYYDHANRYAKEYDPKANHIVRRDPIDTAKPTAMEAAAMERRLDEERARAQDELRRQTESRGQVALERERVRKDYDLMTAQLEHLTKQKEYVKTFAQPNYDFAEERLNQMAAERQKTMNQMVEAMLPPPVLITCPRVGSTTGSADSSGLNVAAEQLVRIEDLSGSSQDVSQPPSQAPRKEQQTKHAGKPLGNANQIQREPHDGRRPDRSGAHRETNKENADHQGLAAQRDNIKRREKEVLEKERKLEQRLKEMFRESQKQSAAASVKVQTGAGNEKNIIISKDTPDAPVQIIIQVNGAGTKVDQKKYPESDVQKAKSVPLNEKAKQVFPKTPAKGVPTEIIDGSTSTAYQTLPPKIKTPLTNVLESKDGQSKLASSALYQYIRRLLGMSRASIDQLELSSVSSVPTPSSSIINVSSNVAPSNNNASSNVEPNIDEQHIDKLTTFINDNHSFIADLEKSLKDVTLSDNEQQNMKAVENAWMHNLAKQEKAMKKMKHDKLRVKDTPEIALKRQTTTTIRPILKKPSSPKKVQVVVDDSQRDPGTRNQIQYEETTEMYNRRIADLNEMIMKVRREKKRLLENTYSSMGSSVTDRFQNSTEYMEFAHKEPADNHSNDASNTTTEPVSLPEDRRADADVPKLAESKQIGLSRDSGLGGISRPVTASDAEAISPDGRPEMRVEPDERPTTITSTKFTEIQVTRKPPSSLNRFGPQLEQLELGHELSTITECDTPVATSRLNSSMNDPSALAAKEAALKILLDVSADTRKQLRITSFQSPPEDEISDTTNLDVTTDKPSLHIRPFPSHKSFAKDVTGMLDTASILTVDNETLVPNHIESPKRPALPRPQRFPSHKEFARDTSGLCTSASIVAAMDDEPFPDIEHELRKRNLLQHSSESESAGAKIAEQIFTKPPSKPPPIQCTSSSDNLEEEMQKLGLNWASSMIKKTKVATHALTSSSSSNDEPPAQSTSKSKHDDSAGRPLNLKDFLARELLKRSNSMSSSSVHDDSTLASQFLRSLLGSSTDSSSLNKVVAQSHLAERHRTSTPLKGLRAGTPGPSATTAPDASSKSATQHLFSGESGLSSVRGGSSTTTE